MQKKFMLIVEIVPKTCWFSNVRSHVDKKTWDVLRRRTYRTAKNVCEICGGRGPQWPVECHEIWHYDDENRIQKLNGLMALCPSCHEVKHIGLANVNGRGDIAAAHLAKINGWTNEQTGAYLQDVWEVWAARSRHQWQLDLSFLESFGVKIEAQR